MANYMPIWLIASSNNLALAKSLRTASSGSKTDITTFDEPGQDRTFDPSTLIDTLELHYPYLTRLNIIGIRFTAELEASLRPSNFSPASASWDSTIAFNRPLNAEIEIPKFNLDAHDWHTKDDVYRSLFIALGAPEWHGRNFNALHDSIVTGGINNTEAPFSLVIKGLAGAQPPAQEFVQQLITLFNEFKAAGCPVSLEASRAAIFSYTDAATENE
jgi:RNAse (barnase) inhibitor barstar